MIENDRGQIEKMLSRFGALQKSNQMQGANEVLDGNIEYNKRWTGKVVDVNDPMKLGRCKIRVFGYYDEVKDDDLPWALAESFYVGSSTANFVVPEIDSIVRGYFENGDIYKPIYTSIVNGGSPLEDAVESFAGLSGPGDSLMNDAVNTDYPNTMVLMKTDQGEGVTLNRKDGKMKIVHRSGLSIEIMPNGTIRILQAVTVRAGQEVPKMEVEIQGDIEQTTYGDTKLTSYGNMEINAIPPAKVMLGNNELKNLVCAHPACFVTGAPTNGGNTNVMA